MPAHYVVCVQCGRQFDASKGGYYNRQTKRYTCPKCGKQLKAATREKKTGMRQSTGAMIAKIAVGTLFVITSFSLISTEGVSAFFVGLIIGAALIAWGLIPYFRAKKDAAAAAEAEALAAAAEAERIASEPKICPVCGARTKGVVCEYCSSPLK